MQVKLFHHPAAQVDALESEVNQWFSANPKAIPIQRDASVFHDRKADEAHVLITIWYELKGNL